MEVQRIDDGLWRWTTPHPDWKEGDDWERDVGCVFWEAGDAIVLIDPLVPTDEAERERFLDALDRDVSRAGLGVAILLTCEWHGRSSDELARRYEAQLHAGNGGGPLPGGTVAFALPAAQEVVYWLPGARSVVPGDVLLGTEDGVTLCPASWLEGRGGLRRLVEELAPLRELPVERVLTSHGPPALADGRAALEKALSGAR